MTFATLLFALIATTAADRSSDPVLLDFQSENCGPCRQMRPAIDQLIALGYPIKAVDVDRTPDLSERYKVSVVPTFVIVDAKGNELARARGAMPARQLATFYNQTKLKAAATASPVEEAEDRDNSADVEDTPATESAPTATATPLVNPRPWETVVRIKMHLSSKEWGFGSGTIIDSTEEESIILTCAHIFRVKGPVQPTPKNFRVPISVDLFSGQLIGRDPAQVSRGEQDIVGEAIDYDFDNDVGLIRIRPGRKLPSSRVVPPWWTPKKGMSMFTVGCSHGADATAWNTTILDPKVTMTNTATKKNFSEIKCTNQPKEGRSGGGLYTSDGYVAGVCDFADPNERVGLYAVPEAIHRLLDRNELMALYKPSSDGADTRLASTRSTGPAPSSKTKVRAQSPDWPGAREVTLPPPELAGIKTWSRPKSAEAPATPRQRPADDSETALAENRGGRVRLGEATPTEASIDPGPDARALESLSRDEARSAEPVPPPVNRAPSRTAPSQTKPKTSGWKGVRTTSPDGDGARAAFP